MIDGMTQQGWSAADLERMAAADELRIAPRATDGGLGREVPIWAVVVGGEVYVRTWRRRDTGWYGRVLRSGRARVRVPGAEADVSVEDVRDEHRAAVDAAYRAGYARYGAATVDRMVGDEAAATTLRLRFAGG
jgi:hypothetical protein